MLNLCCEEVKHLNIFFPTTSMEDVCKLKHIASYDRTHSVMWVRILIVLSAVMSAVTFYATNTYVKRGLLLSIISSVLVFIGLCLLGANVVSLLDAIIARRQGKAVLPDEVAERIQELDFYFEEAAKLKEMLDSLEAEEIPHTVWWDDANKAVIVRFINKKGMDCACCFSTPQVNIRRNDLEEITSISLRELDKQFNSYFEIE